MPRVKRHAKVHASMANHRKTAAVYADNRLLAPYVRLLILGIERYAADNGDSFMIHKRELGRIMGLHRADVAAKSLERLADLSPICAEPDGDLWRITIPNFAIKQGFAEKNTHRMSPSDADTDTEADTKKKRLRKTPPARGKPPEKSPLLNLLSRETGTPKEKADWLARELPLLEEMSARDYPEGGEPYTRELRSRVIRHYRQHLKGSGRPGTAEERGLFAAANTQASRDVERTKAERAEAYRLAKEGR